MATAVTTSTSSDGSWLLGAVSAGEGISSCCSSRSVSISWKFWVLDVTRSLVGLSHTGMFHSTLDNPKLVPGEL